MKRRLNTGSAWSLVAGSLMGLSLVLGSSVALAELKAVGPLDPENGFPLWYQDEDGLTLEACLETNGLCLLDAELDLPEPDEAIDFPANFPGEIFWWTADSILETAQGGRAIMVLALEGAFDPEDIEAGNQTSFSRVRLRVDIDINFPPGQDAGTYTITHPFGVDTFELEEKDLGKRAINFTEDIGLGSADFSGALASRIGPFLTWDSELPIMDAQGDEYIGDPAVEHTVTGSPFGTNYFMIEGPNIAQNEGDNNCPNPNGRDCIMTEFFALSGKVATRFGVGVTRASVSKNADGTDQDLDVFAFSVPNQSIEVSGAGVPYAPMLGDGTGRYFAHIETGTAAPESITVTNIDDGIAVQSDLADLVSISYAYYDHVSGDLTVEASSSDETAILTVYGTDGVQLGAVTEGRLLVGNVVVPPHQVVVTSSGGGSDSANVDVGYTSGCNKAGKKCK